MEYSDWARMSPGARYRLVFKKKAWKKKISYLANMTPFALKEIKAISEKLVAFGKAVQEATVEQSLGDGVDGRAWKGNTLTYL